MGKKETFEYYRRTYVRDNYRCIYCGRDMLKSLDDWLSLEVDHLIPRKKASEDDQNAHDDENLVTSCNVCNKLKSNYCPSEIPETSSEKIEHMRKYVLEKRMAEHLRWLNAIQQYEDFKMTEVLKTDDKVERFAATTPKKIDG